MMIGLAHRLIQITDIFFSLFIILRLSFCIFPF